jgi:hypothetical protein
MNVDIIEAEKRIIFTVSDPAEKIELEIPEIAYKTAASYVGLFADKLDKYAMNVDDDRINVSLIGSVRDPYVSGLNINFVYSNVVSGGGIYGMQLGVVGTNAFKLFGSSDFDDHDKFLAIARFVSTF